jgi:hypothetical protein
MHAAAGQEYPTPRRADHTIVSICDQQRCRLGRHKPPIIQRHRVAGSAWPTVRGTSSRWALPCRPARAMRGGRCASRPVCPAVPSYACRRRCLAGVFAEHEPAATGPARLPVGYITRQVVHSPSATDWAARPIISPMAGTLAGAYLTFGNPICLTSHSAFTRVRPPALLDLSATNTDAASPWCSLSSLSPWSRHRTIGLADHPPFVDQVARRDFLKDHFDRGPDRDLVGGNPREVGIKVNSRVLVQRDQR